ncbi:hypothetical protein Patl1_14430 [Pistacia atlantica]|uniref:Uncharacterized protein n=1 Tax=Pistacia atlantica TaxID=434234 RepID=A0ACC1AY08_9ROSI|nr:hypothetical protein Patl1_14430 [Pistacia atlantica]
MILPSMCLNDLSVLSYVSAGGVLSSLIVVVCVFCVGATKSVGFHGKGRLFNLNGLPNAISLYTFCYGAHATFPPIYNSMRKKKQFPHEKVSAKVAIYTVLAGPIAKYALTVMPISTAIESRLPANYQDSKSISLIIRMALLLSTVVLAAVFPSFQSVASLSGAFLIVVVSFLLPCVCYLKMFQVYKNWGFELAGIVVITLMAVLVGILGTYSSIAQTVKNV